MRRTLFDKANKIIKEGRIKVEVTNDKSIFFNITSSNGREEYDVRLAYKDSVLDHNCTCKHMTLSKPWNLCSHKIAAMIYMTENKIGVDEV